MVNISCKSLLCILFVTFLLHVSAFAVVSIPFVENFESGTISSEWDVNTSNSYGRFDVTSYQNPNGNYQGRLYNTSSSYYSLTEAVLTVDLLGASGVYLAFNLFDYYEQTSFLPGSFTGSYSGDGVSFSLDSNKWYRLYSFPTSYSSNEQIVINVDSVAQDSSLTYTDRVYFKFQHYDNNGSSSYYGIFLDDITITDQLDTFPLVLNSSPGVSSVYGAGTYNSLQSSASISANVQNGYRFVNWDLVYGNPVITNDSSMSTTIQLQDSTVLTPMATPGTVHPISLSYTPYNMVDDYYTDYGSYRRVALKFTAPQAGTYGILASDSSSTFTHYIYQFDSTFSYGISGQSGYGEVQYQIQADSANQAFYFMMYPTSSTYNSYDLYVKAVEGVNVRISNDGNGTTTPDSIGGILPPDSTLNLQAVGNDHYKFSHWSVNFGDFSFADDSAYSTVGTIHSGDSANVMANFSPSEYYDISTNWQSFVYSEDYYSDPKRNHIAFRFVAPAPGEWSVVASDSNLSYSKYLYQYPDSLFGTYSTYNSGYNATSLTVDADSAGQEFWFTVYTSSSYDDYDVYVTAVKSAKVMLVTDGNGSTFPEDSTMIVFPSTYFSATAWGDQGYRLDGWEVLYGDASIYDPFKSTTNIMVHSGDSAMVRANFRAREIYTITNAFERYQFGAHSWSDTTSRGVYFEFTAPAPGTWAVVMDDSTANYTHYLYENADSTYYTVVQSEGGINQQVLYVSADSANQKFYFRGVYSYSTQVDSTFYIRYQPALSVYLETDGNGTTSPSDHIFIQDHGVSGSVSASGTLGYRFDYWSTVHGNVNFGDSSDASTTVSLVSGDSARVRANFRPSVVYDISYTPSAFTIDEHGYSSSYSYGVRMRFTAPDSGSYLVSVSDTNSSFYKYLYQYSDSTYGSYVSSETGYGSIDLEITADSAGQDIYLMVRPNSSSYSSLDIFAQVEKAKVVLVDAGLGGIVNPTIGNVYSQNNLSIYATPDSGFGFSHWEWVSGTGSILDSNSYSTYVYAGTSDTIEVRAHFVPLGQVFDLTQVMTPYVYSQSSYTNSYADGIHFKFTAPDSGTFYFMSDDSLGSHSRYLYYYGADSTMSTSIDYDYISARNAYAFTADSAGQEIWFRLHPYYSSDFTDSVWVSWAQAFPVGMFTDGHGSTSPDSAFTYVPTSTQYYITAIADSGYRFSHWESLLGNVSFADSTSYATYMTPELVDSAAVRAHFETPELYQITQTSTSYRYDTASWSSSYTDGIHFSFILPDSGTWVIRSTPLIYHWRYFYWHTDDSFSSYQGSYNNTTGDVNVVVSGDVGDTLYFRARSEYSSDFTDSIAIWAEPAGVVTLSVSGPGSTSVQQVQATPYANTSILGIADSGAVFTGWTVDSGDVTIGSPGSYSTYVRLNSGTTGGLTANFRSSDVYEITDVAETYQFQTNYYQTSPNYGVYFFYEATETGSCAIVVDNDTMPTYSKYLYSYGDDSTFYSYDSYTSASGDLINSFSCTAGERYYFTVRPSSSSTYYYPFTFNIRSAPVDTLIVTYTGTGSVSPDTAFVPRGVRYPVNAIPYTGFGFDGWTVTSGVPLRTPVLAEDTVELAGNVMLTANFSERPLIELTSNPVSYNFAQDFRGGSPYSGGVYYYFIAPETKTYSVIVQDTTTNTITKHLYTYPDSNFSSYTSYEVGEEYFSLNFSATAGDTVFVRVRPSSTSAAPYDQNFSIWVDTPFMVTATAVDGSVTPDTAFVAPGDSYTFSATANTGFRHPTWSKLSGTGSLTGGTSLSATVHPTSDMAVQVSFTTGQVYTIDDSLRIYTLDSNSYSTNVMEGVRFQFTADQTRGYSIYHYNDEYADRYFAEYDSTYTTMIGTRMNYWVTGNSYTYSLGTLDSGETRYFLMWPYSSSNYHQDKWSLRLDKDAYVNIVTIGGGTATFPYGMNWKDTVTATVSADAGKRFDSWSVTSGNCSLEDSTYIYSEIYLDGDCELLATFVPGEVYEITSTVEEYSVGRNYFSQTAANGVRFWFAPPDTGLYYVVASGNFSKNWSKFGSDSTFSRGFSYDAVQAIYDSVHVSDISSNRYYTLKANNYQDYAESFYISYERVRDSITVVVDGDGSVDPYGVAPAFTDHPYSFTATGGFGYRLAHWDITSGVGTMMDSASRTVTVFPQGTLELTAYMGVGQAWELSRTPVTHDYNTSYFHDPQSYGARYYYNAVDSGWFYLQVVDNSGSVNTVHDYRYDSTYSSSYLSQSASDTLGYLFHSDTGLVNYFRLAPASGFDGTADYSIRVMKAPTLHVASNSQGRVFVDGDYGMIPGDDTSFTAVPWGGYKFSHWGIDSGFAFIDDSLSESIVVTADTVETWIRAYYVLDSNTVPQVVLGEPLLSHHPEICMEASVYDSASGRSIIGMDTSNFSMEQDGQDVPFQLTTVESASGVSVALVVDRSGSMGWNGGVAMAEAKVALRQFVDQMGPLDRTAVVGFDDDTYLYQALTSEKADLYDAIDAIYADGGTQIVDGAYAGIEALLGETNPMSVIIFSDGSGSGDSHSIPETIQYANNNNVTIYSIGIGGAEDEDLRPLAEGTGGYYQYSPSAAGLNNIYGQIKQDVQSRYVLCYRSPDLVIDGDTHTVVVNTSFIHNNSSDVTTWTEDNMPPEVALTDTTNALVGVNYPQNTPLTIKVSVVDDGTVERVRLFYRAVDTAAGPYSEVEMVHDYDSIYTYTLGTTQVGWPGVEFYALAEDEKGMIGTAPNLLAPGKEPFSIPIGNEVPVITFSAPPCAESITEDQTITANITDADGTFQAVLFYKRYHETFFETDTMRNPSMDNETWLGTIPLGFFIDSVANYYIRAIDQTGASVRDPKDTVYNYQQCNALLAPFAQKLDDLQFSDTVYNESVPVIFRTYEDTVPGRENIRIYFTTDGSEPDAINSASIQSGDTVLIQNDVVYKMAAIIPDSGYSATVRFPYYQAQPHEQPQITKLDWVTYPDSVFHDTLWIRLWTQNDSVTQNSRIYYTTDGTTPDSSTASWVYGGDSIKLTDTTDLVYWAVADDHLPSDTLIARFVHYPKVATPVFTRIKFDSFDDPWFLDSACFIIDEATEDASVYYSTNGIKPDTASLGSGSFLYTAGDTICTSNTITARAWAIAPKHVESDVASMEFRRAPTTSTPVLTRLDNHPFPDTLFLDSTCFRLDGAIGTDVSYEWTVGPVDTAASPSISVGDTLCRDSSFSLTAITTGRNMRLGDTLHTWMKRMPQVSQAWARKTSSLQFADTSFKDSVCIQMFDTTAGAKVYYTTNGSMPDTNTSAWVLPGDSICINQSITLSVMGAKYLWKNADTAQYRFALLEYTAPPVAMPSSNTFTTYVDVVLSSATPSATVYYTLDGSVPDTNSTVYTGPIRLIYSDTIRAMAHRSADPWMLPSRSSITEIYTKVPQPSIAQIVDADGAVASNVNYLTQSDSNFSARILHSYPDIDSVRMSLNALESGDSYSITVAQTAMTTSAVTHEAVNRVMAYNQAVVPGDMIIQTHAWDSLSVRWVNTLDASDTAKVVVPVRPTPVASSIALTDAPLGTPIDSLTGEERILYVEVHDQIAHPDSAYDVLIVTDPHIISRTPDTLFAQLTPQGDGTMLVSIPVAFSGQTVAGDSLVQLRLSDKLTITYTDPVDGDVAVLEKVFGEAPEIPMTIAWTEADGSVWSGDWWDPATTAPYLEVRDNWLAGTEPEITVDVYVSATDSIGNTWSDVESVTLTLDTNYGDTGVWISSVPLWDNGTLLDSDDSVQIRFASELIAKNSDMLSNGAAGAIAFDTLKAAYPDAVADLNILPPSASGDSIFSRAHLSFEISLSDQNFSNATDTVLVSAECLGTGDLESGLKAVETDAGVFTLLNELSKNEQNPTSGDGIMSCLSDDSLRAIYVDPIYKTADTALVYWVDSTTTDYAIVRASDTVEVDTLWRIGSEEFLFKMRTRSPSVDKVDTILVKTWTDGGDSMVIEAVETAPYSSEFYAAIPFAFVNRNPDLTDFALEHRVNLDDTVNTALIQAYPLGLDLDEKDADWVFVESSYTPALFARIKDGDHNGAADTVLIQFGRNLARLPGAIDTLYWNQIDNDHLYTASSPRISFMKQGDVIDSSLVVIDFSDEEFEYGETAYDLYEPYLRLAAGSDFLNQKVLIDDGIGATVLTATKYPFQMDENDILSDISIQPDTLVLTISEPIELTDLNSAGPWDELFRVSTTCDDRSKSVDLKIHGEPVVSEDGMTLTLLITENTPFVGNCIYMAHEAPFADYLKNAPEEGGAEIEGENGREMIQAAKPFPPVAGKRKPGRTLYWVPPVGWEDGKLYMPSDVNEVPGGYDNTTKVPFPDDLSAVEVVSTSAYIADVYLYDAQGQFVTNFRQAFGYNGELENEERRTTNKGKVSYLIWDMKDKTGRKVGAGVYIWRITFRFPGDVGRKTVLVKTGVAR